MVEGTLEYIDHQRDSMDDGEWKVYLMTLLEEIEKRLDEAVRPTA